MLNENWAYKDYTVKIKDCMYLLYIDYSYTKKIKKDTVDPEVNLIYRNSKKNWKKIFEKKIPKKYF